MSVSTDSNGWAPPYIESERVSAAPPTSPAQRFVRQHWQILVGVGLSTAGAIIVLLGWYGSAHTTVLQYQLPYLISGGMLGSALIVLGGIYCFAHLLSRNQSRLEQLLFEAIYAAEADDRPQPPRASPEPVSAYRAPTPVVNVPVIEGAAQVAWVSSGTSFHDPACQMVRGKRALHGTVEEARSAGRSPCRVCSPA